MNSLRADIAELSSSAIKYLLLHLSMGRTIFLTIKSSGGARVRGAEIQRLLLPNRSGFGLGTCQKNKKKKLA
jgi:hypothetical protein